MREKVKMADFNLLKIEELTAQVLSEYEVILSISPDKDVSNYESKLRKMC